MKHLFKIITFAVILSLGFSAYAVMPPHRPNATSISINLQIRHTSNSDIRIGFPFNLQAFYDEDTQEIWVEYESLTYQPTPQGVTYITNSSNTVVISCPRVDATIDVSSLLYGTYTLNIEWGDYIATGTVTIFNSNNL